MQIRFQSHIKLIALGIALSFLSSPTAAFSTSSTKKEHEVKEEKKLGYKIIDREELNKWIKSGKSIELIDARPKKFEKGDVIVGAKFLPYDSDEKAITKALPSKEAIIVTYCASEKCPASTYLSEQLVDLGYKNIYKYPGGIDDWVEHGYKTGKAKS